MCDFLPSSWAERAMLTLVVRFVIGASTLDIAALSAKLLAVIPEQDRAIAAQNIRMVADRIAYDPSAKL
jgi:hypothetical protein